MPEVTLLDALEEINPALKLNAILKSFVLFISLCSLVCSFLLVQFSNGWSFSGYNFETSTIDIFILTGAEVVLFPIIAYLAVNATRSHLKNISMLTRLSQKTSQFCEGCFKCNKQASNVDKSYSQLPVKDHSSMSGDHNNGSFAFNSHSLADGEGAQPLLAAYAKGSSSESSNSQTTLNDSSSSSNSSSVKNPLLDPLLTKPHVVVASSSSSSLEGYEEDDERRKEAKKRIDEGAMQTRGGADRMRTVWLFLMFTFSTLVQVFIGLKCISFSYSDEQFQVYIMMFTYVVL